MSVDSDAHTAANIGKNFEKASAVLREPGFENYYYFKDRIGIPCSL